MAPKRTPFGVIPECGDLTLRPQQLTVYQSWLHANEVPKTPKHLYQKKGGTEKHLKELQTMLSIWEPQHQFPALHARAHQPFTWHCQAWPCETGPKY